MKDCKTCNKYPCIDINDLGSYIDMAKNDQDVVVNGCVLNESEYNKLCNTKSTLIYNNID